MLYFTILRCRKSLQLRGTIYRNNFARFPIFHVARSPVSTSLFQALRKVFIFRLSVMTSQTSAQPERERRLATLRDQTRSRRASETAEAREQRLATLRDQTRSRRASETAEAREQRLATLREQTRSRRASETAEAREQRVRARRRERLASETAGERETRLPPERLHRTAHLARESPQRRETRLSQARLNQEHQRALMRQTPASVRITLATCAVELLNRPRGGEPIYRT